MVVILAAGLAAVLATGGYVLSLRGSTNTVKPLPHWGLYTEASWAKLQTNAAAQHLVPASIDIVTGTSLERNHESFAIVRGRTTTGRRCFAVTFGTRVERLVCRVESPLMTFIQTDTCAACAPNSKVPLKTLTVPGLVRRDVQSVIIHDPYAANLDRVPAGGGTSAFNVSAVRAGTTLTVLGSANRPLSETQFRAASKSPQ